MNTTPLRITASIKHLSSTYRNELIKHGQELAAYRKLHRVTQRQVARHLGVTHTIISRGELGLKLITPKTYLAYQNAMIEATQLSETKPNSLVQ